MIEWGLVYLLESGQIIDNGFRFETYTQCLSGQEYTIEYVATRPEMYRVLDRFGSFEASLEPRKGSRLLEIMKEAGTFKETKEEEEERLKGYEIENAKKAKKRELTTGLSDKYRKEVEETELVYDFSNTKRYINSDKRVDLNMEVEKLVNLNTQLSLNLRCMPVKKPWYRAIIGYDKFIFQSYDKFKDLPSYKTMLELMSK